MSKSNPAVENLRQGQTIHFVYGLGKGSFITTHLVMSKPYHHKFSTVSFPKKELAIITRKFHGDGFVYEDVMFLSDANVVPNTYNKHRLFFSRKKAETYLEWCKNNTNNSKDEYEYNYNVKEKAI